MHIKIQRKVTDCVLRQINLITINRDIDFDEIDRIDHLTEIIGITVLPPADPGFIGIPDPTDINPFEGIVRIVLFKHSPHTHVAVTNTGHAFLQSLIRRYEFMTNDVPRIYFKIRFIVVAPPSFEITE